MSAAQTNAPTQIDEDFQAMSMQDVDEVHQPGSESASMSDGASTASYDSTSQAPPFDERKYRGVDFAVDSRDDRVPDAHPSSCWTGKSDSPTRWTGNGSWSDPEQHILPSLRPSDAVPATTAVNESELEDARKYDIWTRRDYQQRKSRHTRQILQVADSDVGFSGMKDADEGRAEWTCDDDESQPCRLSAPSQDATPSRRDAGTLWRLATSRAAEFAKSTPEKEDEEHPTDSSVPTAK